jgi:tyrosyl-tRNA synthetase
MRPMMTPDVIAHNCACFRKQMERFIEFGEDKAVIVNNADWLLDLKYVDLLREVGAHFSVNNMLRAECYKQRMEKGLTFLEFNYMVMQGYDFLRLYQDYGCNFEFGPDKALMVNNADWLRDLNYIEFIRDIGVHFSVNNMLRARCYEQRMEKGLSFLEFNYMIMQAYDFLCLYEKYGCNMQFGGDDQWSNMLAGTELIRKKLGKDAHAMTITLLLNSEGKKMGKTAKGAVWLDPDKTSPYDFYQYWRNIGDADVLKCLRMMTFLPLEQIDEMDKWEGAQLNTAKEILAHELTTLVHGEDEAVKAEKGAKALFAAGGAGDMSNVPEVILTQDDLEDGGLNILTALVKSGLEKSRSDARRDVKQGGVSVDGEKVAAIDKVFDKETLEKGILLQRGKKSYKRLRVE